MFPFLAIPKLMTYKVMQFVKHSNILQHTKSLWFCHQLHFILGTVAMKITVWSYSCFQGTESTSHWPHIWRLPFDDEGTQAQASNGHRTGGVSKTAQETWVGVGCCIGSVLQYCCERKTRKSGLLTAFCVLYIQLLH